tara:strand:+ start:3120 stop:3716 length:597 start_codon:yes stop_codon:yes gene_type:complete
MMELLSKYHKLWVAMGLSIGIRSDLVEDFIHEMYLKLNKYISDPKKIMYNENEPNKFYVYITIKNLWNDYLKAKSKHRMISIDDLGENNESYKTYVPLIDDTNDVYYKRNQDYAQQIILDNIQKEVDSWDRWYDQKLFKIYYETDISMRKLAKDSHISVTSIFNSCKNYKQIMNSKFNEDYQDYINGDFHLIKHNKDE